ncbi:hippurate hydrolase [Breoghania corrubedonensis]|uniref:Hippurate hydrolase n=1 Tax=Breoghania corrubedonensis TaxID=665038 RepID=A0A2T5UN63_9HYPH|nr:M20 aminoacylase family protein [Breoghania corrubedonensis]PTW52950.1 hippurate hydrolase [Breoghania corrubedonensis]
MPIVNRFAELADEITEWRRDLHRNPELLYDTLRTSAIVAEKLEAFGLDEVVTGVGKTGVVGVIRGRNGGGGKTIGLRADMDALPIEEETGKDYASSVPGKMHACGHDGHTAMLLGAAKYLAETRNFDGTAIMIFQPAEEGGGGGRAMVEDGLMTRWGIEEVYGMHNYPGMPVGEFAMCPGAIMAAADMYDIVITGRGGHAAKPHETVDPIVIASSIVLALQTIVSRNADPFDQAVVSVTQILAGTAYNIIPERVTLRGTVRTLSAEMRDLVEARMKELVSSIAKGFGGAASVDYRRNYPVTVNDAERAEFSAEVARAVAGDGKVNADCLPMMAGEDFSFMLEERPGSYIFIGNGTSADLHHPQYDFDDGAIPFGCSYWVTLVEKALPVAR